MEIHDSVVNSVGVKAWIRRLSESSLLFAKACAFTEKMHVVLKIHA
jgi:hypothetical protein